MTEAQARTLKALIEMDRLRVAGESDGALEVGPMGLSRRTVASLEAAGLVERFDVGAGREEVRLVRE